MHEAGLRVLYFYSEARNSLDFKFVLVPSVGPDSVAPTLHSKNGRGNTFFTERRHSEQSTLGLTLLRLFLNQFRAKIDFSRKKKKEKKTPIV